MLDKKLKYLEFVQDVITRMNSNSFLIKGWNVTVVSALFALASKESGFKFAIIAIGATLIFWIMDAYYLSQEKMYRKLYDKVRILPDNGDFDFNMDASPYNAGDCTWWEAFKSKTLGWFYCLFLIIIGIVIYFLLK
jgi:hypothetical protein